ncbi:uncharacterized protein LOC143274944 [Babylonia areolata]|uniref:uncharacterized protein LOC143274944 n=1 Tax=Babylonia areolata TaxID=304850 RepID=UPI003FCF19F1
MEACIEALYTIDGEADKRKTSEMIRILKGAISVSKSRTGEVIYHYNRHEKKALSRMMAKYDRDTVRAGVNIDSQKRDVLRKWNLVFGRQRKFTDSIRGFDDMIQEALANRHLVKYLTEEEGEGDGEEEQAPNEEAGKAEEAKKMPHIKDPRARRLGSRQTAPQGVVATQVMVGVLPKLQTASTLHNAHIETAAEIRMRREREKELERRRKQEELPKFDKELMDAYLTEQKTLQEDLLTRNALMKIKTSVDRDHVFFKYRMKTKLPDSATSLLQRIGSERSVSAMTGRSTRSRLSTRQSTRQGPRPRSPRSTKSQSEKGEVEDATGRLDKVSLTARNVSPSPSFSDIRLTERAKTVHFC